MIKGQSTNKMYLTILSVYGPDRKICEAKTDKLKGAIEKSTVIFGDFNTPLSKFIELSKNCARICENLPPPPPPPTNRIKLIFRGVST